MKTYRILKVEKKDDTGKIRKSFRVQRRYLFIFWMDVFVRTHYFTHTDWNKRPIHAGILTRRRYSFDSELMAKHVMKRLLADKPIYYKGSKIIRVFDDSNLFEDHWINTSHYRIWSDSVCYEWSNFLDDLKEEIDKRVVTTTMSVVK